MFIGTTNHKMLGRHPCKTMQDDVAIGATETSFSRPAGVAWSAKQTLALPVRETCIIRLARRASRLNSLGALLSLPRRREERVRVLHRPSSSATGIMRQRCEHFRPCATHYGHEMETSRPDRRSATDSANSVRRLATETTCDHCLSISCST